ncbi:MAG TPA: glycosyltransferase family 2 protein [Terriglobia bacterium]|nr:glycosyltransferase family 2 protein [Terriglobia bacterium]
MNRVSLSVVIPVFNEEQNIPPLVEKLSAVLAVWPGGAEILFVDDGSTDATLALLRQARQNHPQIRVAHFRRNHGQTAAMAAGFRLAQGDAVVTLDGDLQNDPAEIPRLVGLLKDWDVVCGVRARRRDGTWKKLSSRIANGYRNWMTGDDIIDTGCTLRAYRRQAVADLQLFKGMHRFLPTLLKLRGCRVTQVPVSHLPRLAGKTKYGTWGRMIKGIGDVRAVRWMKKNWITYEADLEVLEDAGGAPSEQSIGEDARLAAGKETR